MRKTIKESDIVQSIVNALMHISYYHSEDFIKAMSKAYEKEQSKYAKSSIEQILINSKMCALGKRPICQDTGIVVAYADVGMDLKIESDLSLQEIFDKAVAIAYNQPENPLRHSIVDEPSGRRKNTKNNAPCVLHTNLVQGDEIDIQIAAKGGGSENKSRLKMLNPNDDIVEWVLDNLKTMGAGWCPPGMLGIGIGGSFEKAALLAKKALYEPINIQELIEKGASNHIEKLRLEIYEKANKLGIGAQGLGGLTTVLDVKILEYPTHAASLPVAMVPNCAATRHIHFSLSPNSGAIEFKAPDLNIWPDLAMDISQYKKVNLNSLSQKEIETWNSGDTLLISGTILTARDAAHKRMASLFESGEGLPKNVNLDNKLLYYVGPVDPVRDEVVGPAGPTTATRMDKFSKTMLEQTNLLGMIGKAERGQNTVDLLKQHKKVYLIAVGGAAYLVSKAIKKSRLLAFEDLGMEAIYEFEVENMPVTVAVDTNGNNIHQSGPLRFRQN